MLRPRTALATMRVARDAEFLTPRGAAGVASEERYQQTVRGPPADLAGSLVISSFEFR